MRPEAHKPREVNVTMHAHQDIFQFRDELIREYERFSRSFANPKAADIRIRLDEEYGKGRYWKAPLVQINPNYKKADKTVQQLADAGEVEKATAGIFRLGKDPKNNNPGVPLSLYKHQEESLSARDIFIEVMTRLAGKHIADFKVEVKFATTLVDESLMNDQAFREALVEAVRDRHGRYRN